MTGFTTTTTISELIDKRPIRKRKRKSFRTTNKKVLKAKQKLLRLS